MTGGSTRRRDAWLALAAVGGLFAYLTWTTWRKWPDLVVDFGAQLYIPWKLSTGALLYGDIAYLPGGPLSQYFHAFLFKLFGVSFMTVALSNLVILALLLALIYRGFHEAADQLTAVAACAAVLCVFAFAHYTTLGIFNYITPYSAEAVHGLALSAGAVWLLARWIKSKNPRVAAAAGVCWGCVFLTKPDMFIALSVVVLAGAILFRRVRRTGVPAALAHLAGGALVAPAGFFLYFLCREGFGPGVHAIFAACVPLLTTSAADNPFYKWCLGLDTPLLHLEQSAAQFLALAGIVAAVAIACRRKWSGGLRKILLLLATWAVLRVFWEFNWFNCGSCLPILCVTLLIMVLTDGTAAGWEWPEVFALLWCLWSLGLLAKLGLFCRIWHYGFVLAMPAFLSAIYLLLWRLPSLLERRGVQPMPFRALLSLALILGLTRLTIASQTLYAEKSMPVGSGADQMFAFDPHYRGRDAQIAAALLWMETNCPPGATLAVLPQGAMLNYLARRDNPTAYPAWNPPEMAAFEQAAMTDQFIRHSPDYIVLLQVDYGEYGENFFGVEKRFGLDLMRWIDAHYRPVWQSGHDWLKDGQFGIKILRKEGT